MIRLLTYFCYGCVFIYWNKYFVHKSFKIISQNSVHHKVLQRRNWKATKKKMLIVVVTFIWKWDLKRQMQWNLPFATPQFRADLYLNTGTETLHWHDSSGRWRKCLELYKTCIFCTTQAKMRLVHYTTSLQEAVFSLELQALPGSCC